MGVMTVSTAGSFTLTGDENQAGTLTSLSDSGSYTVDASGRTVVQGGGGSSYILYLETTGRGFLLTTGSEVGMGFTDPQKGGPFTNASLSATLSFGTAGLTEENVIDSAGVETFNGLGAVSGTADSASLGAGSSSNAFNQTYSITNGTNGRGTITSGGATVSIFYMISTSHMVLMDANNPSGSVNAHPAITISR